MRIIGVVIARPTHASEGWDIEPSNPLIINRRYVSKRLGPCNYSIGDFISPKEVTVRFTDLDVSLIDLVANNSLLHLRKTAEHRLSAI